MIAAMPGTDKSLFAATNLACRRGERLVFAGLAFTLAAGEALILRGPNGSGKSSLLRLMAGLGRPEAGRLRWGGQESPTMPRPTARGCILSAISTA